MAGSKKIFTVEEANAMLPLVRAITQDLVDLAKDVIDRRQRLSHLLAGRELDRDDPYSSELAQVEDDLRRDVQRLQEYVAELRDLGVEPKSGEEGLVDFPAMIDDRPIYLCWRLGEPEVLYWHEIDAGFRGRRPVAAGMATGPASTQDGR